MNASIRNNSNLVTRLRSSRLGRMTAATGLVLALMLTMLALQAPSASAHCDSREGPVVTAAKQALEKGDVKLVLPYVKADQEAELTVAFNQTVAIRKRGAEVQKVADEYFLETTVRLHRVGEGAAYTGIKDHAEESPALTAAETSLRDGSPDEVTTVLDTALRAKVADRFQGVLDARAAEKANPTVETSRERVEAELMFEKYILDISGAIDAAATHEGGSHGV
ncbi:MAG TPA: DUF6448 family protein, partial [Intrasporangium sp.]|nr:DUF6448 family protein [Intrasporangium sp.]